MRMMKFENPNFTGSVVTTFRLGTQLAETLQPGDRIRLMQPGGYPWRGYPEYVVTGVAARPFNQMPHNAFLQHHQYGGLRSAPALVAFLMQRFYPGEFQLNSTVTCVWLKKDPGTYPQLSETERDAENFVSSRLRLAEEADA
ncbi:MAG: hypothetical protein JXQ82_07820 [Methanomicrobiaceae archaeon]|nr:hypothetical protein [Methanomicrobiaceae archaeon]